MNSDGQYTDRHGKILAVGDRVTVAKEEDDVRGTGTIKTLPPEGDDWHSFPRVKLDHNGKYHHIADSNLDRIGGEDAAGQLEAAIDVVTTKNAALRALFPEPPAGDK